MPLLRTLFVRLQAAVLPAVAWLCVLAIGAWLAAGWYWRISAPPVAGALHAPLADAGNAGNEVSSRHLFGVMQATTQNNAAPVEVANTAGLKILGVMTGSGHSPGFAVVLEEGKLSRPVIEGEELMPGIRLEKVLPQGVEITRDGQRETLSLNNNQNAFTPPVPVPPPVTQQPVLTPPPATFTPAQAGKGVNLREGDAKPAEHSSND